MEAFNPRPIIGMQIYNTYTGILSDMVVEKAIYNFLVIFIYDSVVLSGCWDCHEARCIIQKMFRAQTVDVIFLTIGSYDVGCYLIDEVHNYHSWMTVLLFVF